MPDSIEEERTKELSYLMSGLEAYKLPQLEKGGFAATLWHKVKTLKIRTDSDREEEEINSLLIKAEGQFGSLINLCSHADKSFARIIHSRQLDLTKESDGEKNQAGPEFAEKFQAKQETVKTKPQIEDRFKALQEAILSLCKDSKITKWFKRKAQDIFSAQVEYNYIIPKDYRLAIASGKRKLNGDVDSLRKRYEENFLHLQTKSLGLSKRHKSVKFYVPWDHLGIMADLALREENRRQGQLEDLGLDKLAQVARLIHKGVEFLETFVNTQNIVYPIVKTEISVI